MISRSANESLCGGELMNRIPICAPPPPQSSFVMLEFGSDNGVSVSLLHGVLTPNVENAPAGSFHFSPSLSLFFHKQLFFMRHLARMLLEPLSSSFFLAAPTEKRPYWRGEGDTQTCDVIKFTKMLHFGSLHSEKVRENPQILKSSPS